jgi:hypothetical protein
MLVWTMEALAAAFASAFAGVSPFRCRLGCACEVLVQAEVSVG